MTNIVMPAKAGSHDFLKARKNFFFEKKKQKTFAPLRAVLAPSPLRSTRHAGAGRHLRLSLVEKACLLKKERE